MSEKPSDETLREVRNELVGSVMDQARTWGAITPSAAEAEKFIDPIMRKVEVDSAREADAIPTKPIETKTVKQGEWYGEAGHSPQIGGENSRVKGDAEVRTGELGEYKIGKDGKVVPVNGAPMPKQPTVLELAIKKMMVIPTWREQLLAASKLCDKHLGPALHCTLCERREQRLKEIVASASKKLTQRERRLIVGGK